MHATATRLAEPSHATLPQPKVYSYARWSTPEQANGDSFRRQSTAASKWAEARGLILDASLAITDEGVSAYRGTNSTDGGLSRFLEACRAGLIERGSMLLVESLDRLSRMDPFDAQSLFMDIVRFGVTIVTLTDGHEYSREAMQAQPWQLMAAFMVAVRANEESKTKGRRVAAAWEEKRRKVRAEPTKRMTRRGPTWLVPTTQGGWALHPERSLTVQRIYAMTLAGAGEHFIAATLNTEGVPMMGRGKLWHRSTVSKLLRSPAVIGTLCPGHMEDVGGKRRRVLEQPVPNAFPPVISNADWASVRALKDGNTTAVRGRHAGGDVAHMLAGLAKCPACGATMTRVSKGNTAKGGMPKLVCVAAKGRAGCRYVSVPVAAVEAAFMADWGAIIADIPAGSVAGMLDAEYKAMEAAIAGTEDLHGDMADVLHRTPSFAAGQRVAKLEAELRMMRSELVELDERRRVADGGLVRTRIDQLHTMMDPDDGEPMASRTAINAVLRTTFSAAIIDYRTGTIRLQWRQGGETCIKYAWPDAA